MDGQERATFAELDERFDRAMGSLLESGGPISLLFSGGVDSSLVAASVPRSIPVELVAVGVAGARDLTAARTAAALIGRPLALHEPDRGAMARARTSVGAEGEALKEPARSVQLSLAVALGCTTHPVVLAGQGSDELFGGYSHFLGSSAAVAELRRTADLNRLLDADWPLSKTIARRLGRTLDSPFLTEPFLEFARTLPMEAIGAAGPTKPGLRRWAAHRGLPPEIARRPKVALQYGSGLAKAFR